MSSQMAATERLALLAEYHEGRERLFDLSYREEGMDPAQREAELASVRDRQAELWDRYETSVPVAPLSRCPHTGAVVSHSIDTAGLDGLWWNYDAPVRPKESLPPAYFALAGAVKLGEPLENFPFTCRPGPEVPYVVPELLELPGMRAVVSSVKVGAHTGYPVFYFAQPSPGPIRRVNTWGTGDYRFESPDGDWVWDTVDEVPEDYDFDLEPWIAKGRLLWIAPGDASLTLRSHVRRCPYLGLEGRRYPMQITMGEVVGSDWPAGREMALADLAGASAAEGE